MRIGDLVKVYSIPGYDSFSVGIIMRFNKRGEGGKEFIHVYLSTGIGVFMIHDIEVINETKAS